MDQKLPFYAPVATIHLWPDITIPSKRFTAAYTHTTLHKRCARKSALLLLQTCKVNMLIFEA